jgi:hypothetical protein
MFCDLHAVSLSQTCPCPVRGFVRGSHESSLCQKIGAKGENIEPVNLQINMNMGNHEVNFGYMNRCHTDMTVIKIKTIGYIL